MPESLCRLTVAACSDDAYCAVDLALPTDMDIGQLMPQLVDIVHRDKALPLTGRRWRLSRLGDSPLDESMTLNDSSIHDGEVLLLMAVDPSSPEWVACDPSHALARRGSGGEGLALRVVPPICCVLLGAIGAATLAWSAARTASAAQIITATCIAVAAAAGAVVVRRLRHLAVPLSLVAVIFTAAVGFRAVPPGPPGTDLLLASAAVFSVTILLLRLTGCGRACLTTIATVSALIGAVAAAVVMWRLQPNAGGAALATMSLAVLGFAPRLSMALNGIGPSTPTIDDADAGFTHRTLSGLICGASVAASLGAASVALGQLRDPGSALRDTTFTAVIALILLLRVRTHADDIRCIGLAVSAIVAAAAGFAAAAVSAPGQAHLIGALAAAAGTAALGCLLGLTISPIVARTVEVVEYLALAAVVPLACWVGGIFGLARGLALT
jgi:type VII secretion integral membrane protein EccD